MLKKGDLLICKVGHGSWWIMSRDETPEDRHHSSLNADLVSWPAPPGFEKVRRTSWDSIVAEHQCTQIIPADEWADEHYVQVAKWALLQGESE